MAKLPVEVFFLAALAASALPVPDGGGDWPFISIRQTGLFAGNEKTLRQMVESHKSHPGACDEFWFSTGSRKPIPDVAKECEAFARCRAICEEAGILPGYQQGLTLGHGERADILAKPNPGEHVFPADAYQMRADGSFLGLLCPRSPFVLDYEREYAKTVLRVAGPASYWLDDDLRLGVAHSDGCFCDRCIAAFNAQTGGNWTRERLSKALYATGSAAVQSADLRLQWIRFNAESLALYAAQVRAAADELGSDCRLAYQSVSASRLYPARDYGPLLSALSGPARRAVGIRPGDGFYDESDPRGMVRKCLGVAREAERCRTLSGGGIPACVEANSSSPFFNGEADSSSPSFNGEADSSSPSFNGEANSSSPFSIHVCYEEETYPRRLLHKSPGAIVTECALALASGCDSLSLYWFPSESPMPVAEYDRFLAVVEVARPYFERLAASTLRTRLGGLARRVGPCPAPDFSLADEAEFDLACAGIPVTVAEGSPAAFFLTEKTRAEGFVADAPANSNAGSVAGAPHNCNVGFVAGAPSPAVDLTGIGRFPTAARRAKLLDDLDAATGGAFPVRVDECRALRILPRVRPDGRLDSVTLLNLSIGGTGPLTVRLRNPVSGTALFQTAGMAEPEQMQAVAGAMPEEVVVTLPNLGPWQIATVFLW